MKPKLAILMLSWRRFGMLLESLRELPPTFNQPVHLILRVQGMEDLTEEDKQAVHEAARGFTSTDIYFTRDNVGTAAARLDLIHRGVKAGYEYLMFTDDDISFPPGGIDYQIYVLDKYPEIGSISLRPGGIKKIQVVSEEGVCLTTYEDVGEPICEVYLVGSASIMFRSTLYTEHLVAPDPAYYIGTWDWDFVLQIRETGYKVCVITDKKIVNKRGGDEIYRKKRRNKKYVKENRILFIEKWGFDPVKSRRINSNFVRPVTFEQKLERAKKDREDLEKELPNNNEPNAIIARRLAFAENGKEFKMPKQRGKVISIPEPNGSDWRSRMIREQIRQQKIK